MGWSVEYYERDDAVQPAELFEDALLRDKAILAGKLRRIAEALEVYGPHIGGGLIEPCHGYGGLWEARAIFNQWLAREFFGFDGGRVVLLHGYVKRTGQRASTRDLDAAHAYWRDYQQTHRVTQESEDDDE